MPADTRSTGTQASSSRSRTRATMLRHDVLQSFAREVPDLPARRVEDAIELLPVCRRRAGADGPVLRAGVRATRSAAPVRRADARLPPSGAPTRRKRRARGCEMLPKRATLTLRKERTSHGRSPAREGEARISTGRSGVCRAHPQSRRHLWAGGRRLDIRQLRIVRPPQPSGGIGRPLAPRDQRAGRFDPLLPLLVPEKSLQQVLLEAEGIRFDVWGQRTRGGARSPAGPPALTLPPASS
jgi:hypothetical protein